jgi:hypothetical protein
VAKLIDEKIKMMSESKDFVNIGSQAVSILGLGVSNSGALVKV